MHSYLDAKPMAKTLRQLLSERGWSISHSESLEIVARQFGVPNWNVLAARIDQAQPDNSELELPSGWRASNQTNGRLYRMGLDRSDPGAAMIECCFTRSSGIEMHDQFATCMQSISAEKFKGRRLQLTAELRTQDADRGSIWMRVDFAPGKIASFDNMFDRRKAGVLEGTIGWTKRAIVLHVPLDASSINFGFLLKGFGCVWARNFELEEAGNETPLTSGLGKLDPDPTNLNFSD